MSREYGATLGPIESGSAGFAGESHDSLRCGDGNFPANAISRLYASQRKTYPVRLKGDCKTRMAKSLSEDPPRPNDLR